MADPRAPDLNVDFRVGGRSTGKLISVADVAIWSATLKSGGGGFARERIISREVKNIIPVLLANLFPSTVPKLGCCV